MDSQLGVQERGEEGGERGFRWTKETCSGSVLEIDARTGKNLPQKEKFVQRTGFVGKSASFVPLARSWVHENSGARESNLGRQVTGSSLVETKTPFLLLCISRHEATGFSNCSRQSEEVLGRVQEVFEPNDDAFRIRDRQSKLVNLLQVGKNGFQPCVETDVDQGLHGFPIRGGNSLGVAQQVFDVVPPRSRWDSRGALQGGHSLLRNDHRKREEMSHGFVSGSLALTLTLAQPLTVPMSQPLEEPVADNGRLSAFVRLALPLISNFKIPNSLRGESPSLFIALVFVHPRTQDGRTPSISGDENSL